MYLIFAGCSHMHSSHSCEQDGCACMISLSKCTTELECVNNIMSGYCIMSFFLF